MERRRIAVPPPDVPGFRAVPFTGVIYVMSEASRLGYAYGHPDWCNLGQGMPETGPLPGAPPRVLSAPISPADQEYAPVAGIPELRAAVAALYNDLYRRGKASQYTADNVCICGGGRLGLTRTVAALGEINLGHFLPDYTAYEELLDIFRPFTAIPILLEGSDGYRFDMGRLEREIMGRGLSRPAPFQPLQPHRAHHPRAGAGGVGGGGAAAGVHAAAGRVLLALRLVAPRPTRRGWCARRATWTTWTATRW